MQLEIPQLPPMDTIVRSLRVEGAFDLPVVEVEPNTVFDAVIEYRPSEGSGVITIAPADVQEAVQLTLTGHEFLILLQFLIDEGLLHHAGAQEEPPKPRKTKRAAPQAKQPEPAGTVDPSHLEDPHWLRQKHIVEGLSMAQIGRLVGKTGSTVKARLEKHGIEIRSHRGKRTTPRPVADSDTRQVIALAHQRAKERANPSMPAHWLADIVDGDDE